MRNRLVEVQFDVDPGGVDRRVPLEIEATDDKRAALLDHEPDLGWRAIRHIVIPPVGFEPKEGIEDVTQQQAIYTFALHVARLGVFCANVQNLLSWNVVCDQCWGLD